MMKPGDSEIYDVFVSYKRKTASAEARLIRSYLEQRGLRVFMDVTDLHSGFFDESLLGRIAATRNFVFILAPHALDKSTEEGDWLHKEIGQAIASNCNIVPIMLPGFKFPKQLPEDIGALPRYQSVEYSHLFFDAMMDRLVGMLDTPVPIRHGPASGGQGEATSEGWRRRWFWIAAAALAVVAAAALIAVRYEHSHTTDAKILKAVGALRQDFRQAVDAGPDGREKYLAAAEADANAILELDPTNGTGFYYMGEIERLSNPGLFTEKSCPIAAGVKAQRGELDAYEADFYHYLDVEASRPESAQGGKESSDPCYTSPAGYCPQRTAWIDHLLANDLYQESLIADNKGAEADELGRALKYAQSAARLYQDQEHNPGFTQCTSTETLIQLIQARLGPETK